MIFLKLSYNSTRNLYITTYIFIRQKERIKANKKAVKQRCDWNYIQNALNRDKQTGLKLTYTWLVIKLNS